MSKKLKLALLSIGLAISLGEAGAQMTAAQTYARVRPGVVIVKTSFSATMYVKQVLVDNRIFNSLLDSIDILQMNGTRLNAEQKLEIVVNELGKRPSTFFKSTADYRRHSQSITISGTGFFISEDGYLVTNCHVIDESDDHVRRKFILSAFQQSTQSNINALEKAWSVSFTDEQKDKLSRSFAKVYSSIKSILLENFEKKIYTVHASDTANGQSPTITSQATVIMKGESMPGKDIAILKIDSKLPLPIIPLADQGLPRIGDKLYVFGYPDPVTRHEYLALESTLEPTMTSGIVSGIRRTINDWNVVQMDDDINHGNSGGPVCNEKGEVIGIATFGSIESRTGVLASGMNFSIPVGILKQFLESSQIRNLDSDLGVIYLDAVLAFENESYRTAARKFNKIRSVNPTYPGLSYYIEESERNIKTGRDKTEQNIKTGLLIAGSFGFIFLMFWFHKTARQRKRRQQLPNMRIEESLYPVK